jgi:hypothetical protein
MRTHDTGKLFASQFRWTKENYRHIEYPELWFAAARTATKDNPDALQGFHAEYILKIVEEASGVDEEVFNVLEGAHGKRETKTYLVGNPTRTEGTFYESHTKMKEFYKCLKTSCLDSKIIDKKFIEKMAKKYGIDSNMYRVRVLGEFPTSSADAFIPYELATAALSRDISPQTAYHKVFGCDIARYGDDSTVIAIRQGDEFFPYHVLKHKDTMEVAGYIANLPNKEKPKAIFIDVIGIGSGVYDRLKELGYPVIAVNVAETTPTLKGKYNRLRDELWGKMREWLYERRGKLWDNPDNDLIGQLTLPKYKILSTGEIKIQSKDELKRDGYDSTDIADACNLTFASPVSEYFIEKTLDNIEQHDYINTVVDREAGY